MSYTAREWSCGDKITADALNHMEQGIEDAQSKGYECTEIRSVIVNENVTTVDGGYSVIGSFSTHFSLELGKTYIVTFNGVEYECELDAYSRLGDGNFVNYPFFIAPGFEGGNPNLRTENEGTYSVKIESVDYEVNITSQCFCEAISQCVDKGYNCQSSSAIVFQETITTTATEGNYSLGTIEKTWIEGIYPDYVDVTFNGTQYRCPAVGNGNYGTADGSFSDYPFGIEFSGYYTTLATPSAGTYEVSVEADIFNASRISECFKSAVLQSSILILPTDVKSVDNKQYQYYNITYRDLTMAIENGYPVIMNKINSSSNDTEVYRPASYSHNNYTVRFYHVTKTGDIEKLVLKASAYDQPMYDATSEIVS